MFRVVRYKPDSYELLPTPERIFETNEEADAFVNPLQAAGERGWRIQLWDKYKVNYKRPKRSGTWGQVFPTLLKAQEFAASGECRGWYEIWEWDLPKEHTFKSSEDKMACMGPSYDTAKAQGEELTKEIVKFLETKGIHKYPSCLPTWERAHHKRFDELVKKIEADIIELVWEIDCATF